jgi:GTP-binding protein
MIIRSAVYLQSGLKEGDFPKTPWPEIAFAGRSNVGKSSLINTLTGRKTLVRTSRHPGQTRTINFFLINESLVLVDLPGYGFSKAPKAVIQQYQEATIAYLKKRPNLVLVLLLLDLRRRPSEEDKAFLNLVRNQKLDKKLKIWAVLTKSDTLGRGAWKRAWSEIAEDLEIIDNRPVFFSSRTGEGKETLWSEIETITGVR